MITNKTLDEIPERKKGGTEMNIIEDTIITKLLPSVLIAISTSIITVRLSIKQFYTQK